MALQDYQNNFEKDAEKEAKRAKAAERKHAKKQKETKTENMLNMEFFNETGSLCLALHKSKLVAMKRIYKTNVTLNREVLEELRQVIFARKVAIGINISTHAHRCILMPIP